MVAKRGKKPTRKVKSLPARSLTSAQSKKVKGGLIGLLMPSNTTKTGELNFSKTDINFSKGTP